MSIKSLLDETVYEMETVFEHGIADSSDFAERFDVLAGDMVTLGLEQGGVLCRKAAACFRKSRFGTDTESAGIFAELWKYLSICRDRLEYYNIKDRLEEIKN